MQQVILVNEEDAPLGIMEKMEAHEKGLLHRAFSVFIYNSQGEMLLQQRAIDKYHSPNLWTNACCSHPQPGEDTAGAAYRRLEEEMGFQTPISKAFSFIYKTDFDNGLTEHEYDHVFIGYYEGTILPNSEEVQDFRYMSMDALRSSLLNDPSQYTSWFKIAFPRLEEYLASGTI